MTISDTILTDRTVALRQDFPILQRMLPNGRPLIYLDNAATSQKPQSVLDAMDDYYRRYNANVHRGVHTLSEEATAAFEAARTKVAKFVNAPSARQIVFTRGATESINLVAHTWGRANLGPGDEVLITEMEHHANIVPWHFLRERQGVVLKWVEPEPDGSLAAEKVIAAIGPKTRLIAVTQMSNVTGARVDVARICRAAKEKGVPVLVDGSQGAVHAPVSVPDLGCDFYAITGHKLYGPSGSGAIWISRERMAEMRPFLGGGDMIREVGRDAVTYADPPMKFEAGTPGIVQQIGLGVALDYLMALGMENVAAHEAMLRDYAMERLKGLNWLNLQGTSPDKGAIFSFTLQGAAHAHDISTVLDKRGVAVRAGTHCAMPLMQHFGVSATCRASFGLYNTKAEVDALVDALELCHDLFG